LKSEQERLTQRMSELDPSSAEYGRFGAFHMSESEFARATVHVESQGAPFERTRLSAARLEAAHRRILRGWQMRIALAKLLLESHLLLLDEPTNTWTWKHATGWRISPLPVRLRAGIARPVLPDVRSRRSSNSEQDLHFNRRLFSYEVQKTRRRAQFSRYTTSGTDRAVGELHQPLPRPATRPSSAGDQGMEKIDASRFRRREEHHFSFRSPAHGASSRVQKVSKPTAPHRISGAEVIIARRRLALWGSMRG